MIMYYVFDSLPSPTVREAVVSVAQFPLFFGTVLFALEAVGVVSITEFILDKIVYTK